MIIFKENVRKIFLIMIVLLIIILLGWNYENYMSKRLTPKKKTQILEVVNSYYDNLQNKKYKEALELIDYRKSDIDKDIEKLNNANGYKIKTILEGHHWVMPVNGQYDYISYNNKTKCFVVQTGANIIYNDYQWEASELVYIKKIGNAYKIVKIVSDDKYCYLRGGEVNKLFEKHK